MERNIIDIVRSMVGRRWKISQMKMAEILIALEQEGLSLINPYIEKSASPLEGVAAHTWADMCTGFTCISLKSTGLRDGYIRYDQPGSMHPLQYSDLTFVPETAGQNSIDYMRKHASRVLVVRN